MIQIEKAVEAAVDIAALAAIRAGLAVFELAVLKEHARRGQQPSSYAEWLFAEHDKRILRLIDEATAMVEASIMPEYQCHAVPAVAEIIEYVDHSLRASLDGVADVTAALSWWPSTQNPGTCDINGAISERMWLLLRELHEAAHPAANPQHRKEA